MEFLPPHSWALALEQGGLLQELACNDKGPKIFWKSQKDSPQISDKLWSGLDWNHLPSLQVISFRRLLTKRAISESQLMIAAWPKQSATPATGKVFMDWLAWSFRRLFEGQTPKKDKDGRVMEEGRLVIWNGLPVILASHTVPATFFVVGAWQTKRRKAA